MNEEFVSELIKTIADTFDATGEVKSQNRARRWLYAIKAKENE